MRLRAVCVSSGDHFFREGGEGGVREGVRVGVGRCQSRAAAVVSERTRALPSPSIAG